MKEFNDLLEIADQLLGPNGCSWDKEQTLFSLQPYLLEETHELIEAIDLRAPQKISEELGDVLYALVFVAKLGEAAGSFDMKGALQLVCDKLIRRHPHVFGDVKVNSREEIVQNWEEIKKKEKGHKERKGIFEGIPLTLPSLPKAQKMAHKLKRKRSGAAPFKTGEELGEQLWELISWADQMGIDVEGALRRKLQEIENAGDDSQHEG